MLHPQPGSDIEWQDDRMTPAQGRGETRAQQDVLLHGRMDLPGLTTVLVARSRADLVLSDTVAPLAGGTWLYSEPQPELTALVDLTTLGWTPWEAGPDGGLSLAATCTIAEATRIEPRPGWSALPLFGQCAGSLLASFKVQAIATVGGNIATALAAGAMIALATALDAELVIWTPDGGERRQAVESFVLAQRRTALAAGEVIRSVEFPPHAMAAGTAFRRIALSPLGRAGTVVAGRADRSVNCVLSVTGGTDRPEVLRFAAVPSTTELAAAVDGIRSWFTDPHGAADWRRSMTLLLADQVVEELREAAG
jgi:CO/xanthine dehydrogenase FAD-binding subunit